MAKEGSCLFRIGYFFYTRTRIGKIYHRRDIANAREKYPDGQTHSVIQPVRNGDLTITPYPILLDNYSYIVKDSKSAIVVDPGDPQPVIKYLKDNEISPEAVLVTHKHWDHSGGNEEMKQEYPNIRIYGGIHDQVNNVTNTVDDQDVLTFGDMRFTVHFTPGHTEGHVVYMLDGAPYGMSDSLFSGDHLFLGGCGRMFEAAPSVMLGSLDKVSKFKGDVLVWPGHEYAKDNLDFACYLESSNEDARKKFEWVKSQREKNLCTCPSTIEEEIRYNPFLRTSEPDIIQAVSTRGQLVFNSEITDETRAKILREIRYRKDTYKYKL
ncbi:putative thioesterase PNKD [Crassostrea virginica]|uniref:Probable hydrolase PNKD n=1 Tax=Crassostrea virginica TaxID=6565 RepID=A0A8B8A9F1_CRAVI|nr:probable hydrolase PNKD [Crassostrea virginica]XP_022286505.1 probable hydrolase PNKD [Crassostrea virginica]